MKVLFQHNAFLCFRTLYNHTVKDMYAVPHIEGSLHLLAGTKYFSKLDLDSGYWQVEVAEEDKWKTASLGFYMFNIMHFGLRNAHATFQRLMEMSIIRSQLAWIYNLLLKDGRNFEEVMITQSTYKVKCCSNKIRLLNGLYSHSTGSQCFK